MNTKKIKTAGNNENLCPFTRKRLKSTTTTVVTAVDINSLSPTSGCKRAKLQDSSNFISSPLITAVAFEDMGFDMLDSEDSLSSLASTVVLAASADENSNEATPNLDAPKLCHQRINYRTLNASETSIEEAGDSFIEYKDIKSSSSSNQQRSNCNNNIDIVGVIQQQQARKNSEKIFLPQHKKVAILGVGAGIKTSSNNSSSLPTILPAAVSGVVGVSGNSNSIRCKITRSPLATVTSNRNFHNPPQQQQQLQTPNDIQNPVKPHAVVGGTTSQNAFRSFSPSMPSTSRQAALFKQQQHQQDQIDNQEKMQAEQLKPSVSRSTPNENFFLYRNQELRPFGSDGHDYFTTLLSDEIILQIFKWLPKKTLIRCNYVCRRLNRCANDESLWTRLDLGGRSLRSGAMESIMTRGVVILRLAQTELNDPIFSEDFLQSEPKYEAKLQYLDLSMVTISKPSLKMLLSRCRQLKKLSLEHVPVNDEICKEIAKNPNLEALNLAMCLGLEAWSVRDMMTALKNLNSLNISWTNLSIDAVTSLVTNITPNIMRLNIAGCRKTMFDSHLGSLVARCPQLLELDLSDCTGLTANAIAILCKFNMLEYLSLSRCYQIPASSYMELIGLPTLTYLDVFGILSDTALEMLERKFSSLGINKFIHSSVARPTVGTRRTSIWGLRTRD